MRAADPPDTVTFRFRGRWEQYGATDVPPDAIFVDFAAGSTFIASPNMDSRLFRGRWTFSMRADDPHDTVTISFRGRWAFSQRADAPPDIVAILFRGRWVQYGTSDVSLDAIFADFAAGSAFIASPDMDSRHFRGRWAFSQRADGPPDTATIRFRGRWEQYGTHDVPPDAIIADFAAGSAFVASPGMDSRRFRGWWEDSMKQLIHNILIKRLIVAKEGIYCFLAGKYRRPRTQIYTAVVKTEDAGWLCTIRNLTKGIGNELLPSMHGRIGGNGNVQGQ